MPSCNNTFNLCQMIQDSGILQGSWKMILLSQEYTPSCTKMVTEAMFPPECIIAQASFAVSLDKENVCIQAAQDQVVFQGISDLSKHVAHIALMTPMGLMAACYGSEVFQNLVKSNQTGQDLVVEFKEDRSVFGI